MENSDILDLAFYFNTNMYAALSDEKKLELLLVIQGVINSEMKKLILTTDIPEA